jgi:hypothetical protein
MEKIKQYQQIIASTLKEYATSNVPGMEDEVLLDFENNHFQLVTVGWNEGKYLFLPLFHLDIKPDGKIWLMVNNTDVRIAEVLVTKGVPRMDIVLGFQPQAIREYSDYAAA